MKDTRIYTVLSIKPMYKLSISEVKDKSSKAALHCRTQQEVIILTTINKLLGHWGSNRRNKKITIALLRSHRNTQQSQVRLKSVLFRVRISNSAFAIKLGSRNRPTWRHCRCGLRDVTAAVDKTPLCKIWKSAKPKKLHLNNVVLSFKNIIKFRNFFRSFKCPVTEFSIYGSDLIFVSTRISLKHCSW